MTLPIDIPLRQVMLAFENGAGTMGLGLRQIGILALLGGSCAMTAHAAERVTLRGGFTVDCVRREVSSDHVRLYLNADGNYMEVSASSVISVEALPEVLPVATIPSKPAAVPQKPVGGLLPNVELSEMLSSAETEHRVDADLLAAVVHAESGGQVHAVSRAGAQGLMQLMPSTAATLGVKDSFAPKQNIEGGSAYLDSLLSRYNDNIALALAAYNAGAKAVDRYHGVPPYAETRAYVARVIREFNRRKQATLSATLTR